MKRKFEVDGEQVRVWYNDHEYTETNKEGEGLFYVNLRRNQRSQTAGTCDFSARGLKPDSKKAKLRRYLDTE